MPSLVMSKNGEMSKFQIFKVEDSGSFRIEILRKCTVCISNIIITYYFLKKQWDFLKKKNNFWILVCWSRWNFSLTWECNMVRKIKRRGRATGLESNQWSVWFKPGRDQISDRKIKMKLKKLQLLLRGNKDLSLLFYSMRTHS